MLRGCQIEKAWTVGATLLSKLDYVDDLAPYARRTLREARTHFPIDLAKGCEKYNVDIFYK